MRSEDVEVRIRVCGGGGGPGRGIWDASFLFGVGVVRGASGFRILDLALGRDIRNGRAGFVEGMHIRVVGSSSGV